MAEDGGVKGRSKWGPLSYTPRNLDSFKDEILEHARQGDSDGDIHDFLAEKHDFEVSVQTIGRRLNDWGFSRDRTWNSLAGYIKNLDAYREDLMRWESEGHDVVAMLDMLQEKHGVRTRDRTIEKAIARWQESGNNRPAVWRDLTARPSEPILTHSSGAGNLLNPEELDELKEAIAQAHIDERPRHSRKDPTRKWARYLIDAACYDESVQEIMLKEWQQPGHHWSNERKFHPGWVLGLYLPGGYVSRNVDTEAKIIEFVNQNTPAILEKVREKLAGYLGAVITEAKKEFGDEYCKKADSMWPATTPPLCLSELLRAGRRELDEWQQDIALSKSLKKLLVDLPENTACKELADFLLDQPKPFILSGFTVKASEEMKRWKKPWMVPQELTPLTDADMRIIQDGKPAEIREEIEEDVGSGIGQEGTESCRAGRHRLALLDRVWNSIPQPQVFSDWRPPTTGALLGSSPSRFGFEPWNPEPQIPEANAGTAAWYNQTIDYMAKVVESRTPQEEAQFDAICRRMMQCTTRPPSIAQKSTEVSGWTTEIRADDWLHCRRLLQMLAQRFELGKEDYHNFEGRLMMLLAATEGGSTESALWLLPIEGLILEISTAVIQLPARASEIRQRQDLLREFASFVHAATIQSMSLRCFWRRDARKANEPWNKQKWYDVVTRFEPRCATRWCLRPLPDPRVVTQNNMGVFSVGCNDARSGDPTASLFISDNRRPIYGCLVGWFRIFGIDPTLVNAFFWFGGIYHTESVCTSGSGKHKERENW